MILLLWFAFKINLVKKYFGESWWHVSWAGRDSIRLPSLSWCGSQLTRRWQAGIWEGLANPGGLVLLCKKAADLGCDHDTGLAGCRHAAIWNGCLFPHSPARQTPSPPLRQAAAAQAAALYPELVPTQRLLWVIHLL